MERSAKLEMLQNLNEKDLTQKFLIPLYESEGMGCKNVQYTHKHLEFGKDVIYYKDDEYGRRIYTAVQVKRTKITTKDNDTILRQLSEAFGEQFNDSSDNKKKSIDRFVILTSNEIVEEAKQSLSALLRPYNLDKNVTYLEGNQLVTLLETHLRSAFWDEYDYCNKYFTTMKNDFETIKDLSVISQKEPIPLEGIYVSLKLIENVPGREISIEEDILDKDEFRLGFTIISKPFISMIITEKRRIYKQERIMDLEDATKKFDKLVIVGAPGSGKTTLLYHLALKACEENLAKNERIITPIPIILRLFSNDGKNLREYIDQVFEYYNFPKAKDFIEKDLNDGKCLLLLDGFDELANRDKQNKVKEQIEKFVSKYPKNRVIVTSRIAGYNDELKEFTTLKLMEFDDDQIKLFITNWFGKTNPEKTRSMIETIEKNENIKALARNPLMISIIAIIYEEERHLPQRRGELYKLCTEVLLNRWDLKRKIKNKYDEKAKEKILRKLALEFHILEKRTFTKDEALISFSKNLPDVNIEEEEGEDVLNEIVKRNALLKEISIGTYEFIHLSFQEYFTALELREQKNFELLLKHLYEPWWEEVILLFGGFDRDATELIHQIQYHEKKDIQFKEDIFYNNLLLLGKCIADADYTNQNVKNQIAKDLWHIYQIAEFSSLKKNVIEILSIIKPHEIIHSNIEDLESTEPVIRANAATALGHIGNEMAIKPLINALTNDKEKDVRGRAAEALGNIKSEKAVDPLMKALTTDKESDVRFDAAIALGNIGNEKTIDAVVKALITEKGNPVKKSITAGYVLSQNQNKISEKSLELLNITLTTDKESGSREMASLIIGLTKSEKAIEPLIKALINDKDERVRYRVAEALGNIGNEKGIEPLIQALITDKKENVRASAARSLGNIKSEKAIEPLIVTLTTDKEKDVRGGAAKALGNIKSEKAVDPLIKALATDKEKFVRGEAAEALGNIKSEKAIEPLILALTTDKEKRVQARAAKALGNIKSEKAIDPLILALTTNRKTYVRENVANALGKIGNEKIIEPLIKALITDKVSDVRASAAKALGNIKSEKAIDPLIKALINDKISDVRGSAADALGKIGNESAIEPLICTLKEEGMYLGDNDKVKDIEFNSLEKISRRIKKRIPIASLSTS